ncbi:hypothetical protein BC952_1693 [Flavobacterium limicola]|uniref:Uncharacterized protein n=1 Tax=Flavobacterium limicola TaxID=180441 RepID=A0A495S214_9FLAO|nr:hypothetical protein [Flavobacterium limicola]RKS93843.1 hypothetical protein BC952_1693 [Flavobacterium limicola]
MSVQQFEKVKIAAPFLGEPLVHIVGQDPLGLLNTGGKTFDLLLPGLNNVTDRIRYYSFYCWFFHCYAKYISKPSKKEQFDHLRRAEFILSLLAARNGVQGIGGITKAQAMYNKSQQSFDLTEGTGEDKVSKDGTYWKNPRGIFGQNYVSSLKQLNLIREFDVNSEFFIRTEFDIENKISGHQLAVAFEENLGSEIALLFVEIMKKGVINQSELEKLTIPFNMLKIPTNTVEHNLIWQLITGNDEPKLENSNLFRKKTIQLLLETVTLDEEIILDNVLPLDAYHSLGLIDDEIDETFSLWYFYQLEQFWHMACTGSLSTFLKILNKESNGNWIDEEMLIDKIANQVVEFLKSESYIDNNQTFKELIDIDLLEEEVVYETKRTNDNIEKIGYNILLVKKLIINNNEDIERLLRLTKKYNLNSNSSFLSAIVTLQSNDGLLLKEYVKYFLKKYVIIRHQWVSLKKMNNTQSTEKFIREDGLIRFIDDVDYAYSSPRLNTLIDFLRELQLIKEDKKNLTTIGLELFNSL